MFGVHSQREWVSRVRRAGIIVRGRGTMGKLAREGNNGRGEEGGKGKKYNEVSLFVRVLNRFLCLCSALWVDLSRTIGASGTTKRRYNLGTCLYTR